MNRTAVTEILFYHLQGRSLEQTLPDLLEKCLERGWRSVVQLGSRERCEALDAFLWTYRDESFLPHGSAVDGNAARQPIWITADGDNPNGANVRFFADGAAISGVDSYQRAVLLFDGNDIEMVEKARSAWKALASDGHQTTYWQQSAKGGWEKKG